MVPVDIEFDIFVQTDSRAKKIMVQGPDGNPFGGERLGVGIKGHRWEGKSVIALLRRMRIIGIQDGAVFDVSAGQVANSRFSFLNLSVPAHFAARLI
jgi:hypothetical protein